MAAVMRSWRLPYWSHNPPPFISLIVFCIFPYLPLYIFINPLCILYFYLSSLLYFIFSPPFLYVFCIFTSLCIYLFFRNHVNVYSCVHLGCILCFHLSPSCIYHLYSFTLVSFVFNLFSIACIQFFCTTYIYPFLYNL